MYPDRDTLLCSCCPHAEFWGDARYTKSIYALLSRSIAWSLLCYCVRNRDCCCVLCDVARDLLLTWYIVHQPIFISDWQGHVARSCKGSEGTHKRRKPVRSTPEEFENAAKFLRLLSTLIRHENGAFRNYFSHLRNSKTPAFCFRVERTETCWKRRFLKTMTSR